MQIECPAAISTVNFGRAHMHAYYIYIRAHVQMVYSFKPKLFQINERVLGSAYIPRDIHSPLINDLLESRQD